MKTSWFYEKKKKDTRINIIKINMPETFMPFQSDLPGDICHSSPLE